jgi:predicted nucleotidyltransferase
VEAARATDHDPPMAHRLSPAEDALLRDFIERLTAQAPPGAIAAVRVFGSRARGESDEHSDLDVAVELVSGADRSTLHRLAIDLAWEASEARDAHDLGLAPVVLLPGPSVGLRDAIARDGFEVWRAPW